MSAASSSSSSSQSSSNNSEDDTRLAHACRWGWCRDVFFSKATLIEHVLEHTRHVVPVRRKDVALMRKIEEGTQESLRMSLLRESITGSAVGSQQHADSYGQEPPRISLPSPPHSTGMLHTPGSQAEPLLRNERSSSSSSDSSGSESDQNALYASAKHGASMPITSKVLRLAENSTPTFASLNSPTNSQTSQASRVISNVIPNSPSFSSLVKRKSELEHPQRLSRFNPLSLSQSSSGSSESQISVEKQLTQSPGSEAGSEPTPRRQDVDNDNFSPLLHDADVTMSQNLYEAELPWGSVQASSQDVFLQESNGQAVEFELMTQPPSQLQLGTFPFHNHRRSQNFGASQAEPASSIPFRPSPPAHATDKAFKASTPQPQPARRQTRSQSRGPEPPAHSKADDTPVKRANSKAGSSKANKSTTPKPKTVKSRRKSFRSGTLQITPIQESAIPEETSQQMQGLTAEELLDIHNPYRFSNSPVPSHSSFLSQDSLGYSQLQTQAPYESQPMTQF